jgi:hypothetical protein
MLGDKLSIAASFVLLMIVLAGKVSRQQQDKL